MEALYAAADARVHVGHPGLILGGGIEPCFSAYARPRAAPIGTRLKSAPQGYVAGRTSTLTVIICSPPPMATPLTGATSE